MQSSEFKLSLVILFRRVVLVRFIWLKNHLSMAFENGAQRLLEAGRFPVRMFFFKTEYFTPKVDRVYLLNVEISHSITNNCKETITNIILIATMK